MKIPESVNNRYHPDYLGINLGTVKWDDGVEFFKDIANRILGYGRLCRFEDLLSDGDGMDELSDSQIDMLEEFWEKDEV